MKQLRLLLLPFSFIYGFVLFIRHFLYDRGWLKSYRFSKPVLVVGNLVVGGAGKSPMTEYLIRLLSPLAKVAILSRGYGRKTVGFVEVQTSSRVDEVGDEPLQFKTKFPDITVADCENRVVGLTHLMNEHDVFILDDAFQHRRVEPSLGILLFDFDSLQRNKLLLPAGNYRDLFWRRNRANAIVVTKTPVELTEQAKNRALRALALKRSTPVFFSWIDYGSAIHLFNDCSKKLSHDAFMVVTGIANPVPFLNYLKTQGEIKKICTFEDHHQFTIKDIAKIKAQWESLNKEVIIVTTEKDAMRLKHPELRAALSDLPIYYIPIELKFHETGNDFDSFIRKQVFSGSISD